MTVRELRDKLSKFDDETRVVVYTEDKASVQWFEIDDVSIHAGTPSRSHEGKVRFAFDSEGETHWVLISVSAE